MSIHTTSGGPLPPSAAHRSGVHATVGIVFGLVYLLAVVAANWLTDRYGEVQILPGITVVAGTFAAGLAILTRNLGQDVLGRLRIVGLMLIGCLLSWWLASPQIAVASVVAFGLSEAVDMSVFTWLRDRGLARSLAAAGVVGSIVDTTLFLSLAHLPVTGAVVAGQLLIKGGISLLVAASVNVGGRVRRS